jgi:hypothetical protein
MNTNPIAVAASELGFDDIPFSKTHLPPRRQIQRWPEPLDPIALWGLAGDVVGAIEPVSEADPAALLLQLLAAFGNLIGARPFVRVESTHHHMNLFVVVVGATSKARKGTSWNQIRGLVEEADPDWAGARIQSGLSSGEGVIHSIRDPKGEDPGVADKRILVMQGELCGALKVMEREGNTLSAVLRDAWDSGHLRNMTTKERVATGGHVSIIGHITRDELRAHLRETDKANGFGNRFLWVCAKRSKCLPEPASLESSLRGNLIKRLQEAAEFARIVEEISRDEEARALWCKVYPELSEGHPGMFGAITSRAEAQVLRLGALYALLDKSDIIRRPHMEAALACWQYAEDSARFIFGDSLGDPFVDTLLAAIRESEDGLTRTEIRDLFNRNKNAARIDQGLAILEEYGKVFLEKKTTGTKGRPEERWLCIRRAKES